MRSVRSACLVFTIAAAGAAPALVVAAGAAEFPLAPHQAAVGEIGGDDMRPGEVLVDVARQFDLGYVQLVVANPGVDPWLTAPGRSLTLPALYLLPDAPRRGIVINLAEQRLFYFPPGGRTVETFPIGVGVIAGTTPVGVTRVVAKEAGPTWVPPPSVRAEEPDLPPSIPPGPDNPLGAFALRLGWNNYLIHGTNKPYGVGRDVSHGCVRLYPEDIDKLFHEVPVGTMVRVADQQVEIAWVDDKLMVEVHPDKARIDAIDLGRDAPPTMPPDLVARVTRAAGDAAPEVDWNAVDRAGRAQDGMPVAVLTRAPSPMAELREPLAEQPLADR